MKIKIFSFLMIFSAAVFCQRHEPVFEHVSINEGFFQGTVNCIMQDSRGFIWFGTSDGLARYDGYSSRVFKKNQSGSFSLPENNITAVTEDYEGNIWIGTAGGYLCRYDPFELKIKSYKLQLHSLFHGAGPAADIPPVYAGFTSRRITSIIADSSGSIWAGSFGCGLFRLFPDENKQVHYYLIRGENTISSDYITSLAEGTDGVIWVATLGGGLNKITRSIKNNRETKLKFIQLGKPGKDSLNIPNITSLVVKNNKLWIAAYDKGIYYHDMQEEEISKLFSAKEFRFLQKDTSTTLFITSLTAGKNDYLWIGTYGSGLIQADVKTGYTVSYKHSSSSTTSIDNNNVIAILADSSGLVWAATLNGIGINKLIPGKTRFENFGNSNPAEGNLSNNTVTAMAEDSKQNIWIGTLNGLNCLRQFEKRNDIYINNPANPNSVAGNNITSLLTDQDKIWIGTFSSGLDVYDPVKKIFTHYRHESKNNQSISSDRITSLFRDGMGNIWIGTSDAGLNRAAVKDGMIFFTHYFFSDLYPGTLPENNIRQIFSGADGIVNILTSSGYLCRYDEQANSFSYSKIICRGFPEAEIIYARLYSDALYIGTASNGLFITDTENRNPARQISTPVLKDKAIISIFPYRDELFLGSDYGLLRYNAKDSSVVLYNVNDGLQGMKFSPGVCFKSINSIYFGGVNGFNWFDVVYHPKNDYKDRVYISSFKSGDIEYPVETKEIYLADYQNTVRIEFSLTDYTDPFKNQYLYKLEGYDKEWKYASAGSHSAEYSSLPAGEYTFYVKGINSSGGKCKNIASIHFAIAQVVWKTWWFIFLAVIAAASAVGVIIYLRLNHYLAVEKLKAKISADLHDSIGSGLTEIALLSDISQMDYNKLAGHHNASLETIAVRSRELIDSMSDIVWLVNPKPKSLYDLFIRLKETYAPIFSQKGIKFIVNIPESFSQLNLSMEERQNIYLIFKEAINNSIKYSSAANITFSALREESHISISLRDDGRGFDISAGKGNGLLNMKKRAAAINSSIDIISEPGRGSLIALNVKL